MKFSYPFKYSKQDLWDLFLICAFPFHLWTLIMAFRDTGWLIERTNLWDAVGIASYGMLFALLETTIIFFSLIIMGLLIPSRWKKQRVTFLGMLILILALWSAADQFISIWEIRFLPASIVRVLIESNHPIRYFTIGMSPIILLTFLLPAYLILQTEKGFMTAKNIAENISLLSLVYMLLSIIGIVIVAIRNI
jgi:hypothetical protein